LIDIHNAVPFHTVSVLPGKRIGAGITISQHRLGLCECEQSIFKKITSAINNYLLNFAATYSTVAVTVTLYRGTPYGGWTQTLTAAHITPAQAAQIRNADCSFISYQPHAVASSADLARHCLRGRGHHRAWVTVASWQLKWCLTTVGNNHRMLRSNTYGMCCYIPRYGGRAEECYWTKSI